MTDINPATVLQRAADLRVEFDHRNEAVAAMAGNRVPLGRHGFELLQSFHQPTAISEVLQKLKPQFESSLEWINALRLCTRLHESGALIATEGAVAEARLDPVHEGFDQASIHIEMLDDRTRTDAFIKALQETVRPGDVVVDIGTGTGALAAAAARAGARKVYAIEKGEIADAAGQLFAANGLSDRVEVVRGLSTEISLPESADLIVGEILGHDPLDENIIEVFLDARRRHLKPDGRIAPAATRLTITPVDIPADVVGIHRFTPDALQRWQENYQLDFSPLNSWQDLAPCQFLVRPEHAAAWRQFVSANFPPIEFAGLSSSIIEFEESVEIQTNGVINGLVVSFELEISDGVRLTTQPGLAPADNHWRNPVHLLSQPINVKQGDRLCLRYEHGNIGQTQASARLDPRG